MKYNDGKSNTAQTIVRQIRVSHLKKFASIKSYYSGHDKAKSNQKIIE